MPPVRQRPVPLSRRGRPCPRTRYPLPRSVPRRSQLPAYRAADPPTKDADGLLDLANNELTLSPLPAVVDSLRLSARSVHLYPDPTARTLRHAVARHFATDPEEIVVGPGSGAVLHQLLLALCGPGDEVLYPRRPAPRAHRCR
ncbi:aminotransferase class I/II-fold pyridoxal phosphate-dependent enzyme [Streptomyces sp. NPDC046759]|uniref:aminotransferase class I/II-fold pyridoxal phosphate-dependent enzyme n=1 Tax=Streptomyces sp. NPDC046759 TaxID=3155019 RepID=UPI003411B89E